MTLIDKLVSFKIMQSRLRDYISIFQFLMVYAMFIGTNSAPIWLVLFGIGVCILFAYLDFKYVFSKEQFKAGTKSPQSMEFMKFVETYYRDTGRIQEADRIQELME